MSLTSVSRVAFQQPALIDVYSPFDGSLVGSVANLAADAVPGLLARARQGVREAPRCPGIVAPAFLNRPLASLNVMLPILPA